MCSHALSHTCSLSLCKHNSPHFSFHLKSSGPSNGCGKWERDSEGHESCLDRSQAPCCGQQPEWGGRESEWKWANHRPRSPVSWYRSPSVASLIQMGIIPAAFCPPQPRPTLPRKSPGLAVGEAAVLVLATSFITPSTIIYRYIGCCHIHCHSTRLQW